MPMYCNTGRAMLLTGKMMSSVASVGICGHQGGDLVDIPVRDESEPFGLAVKARPAGESVLPGQRELCRVE